MRSGAPIYVVRELWESLEDMSQTLEEMRRASPESDDLLGD